MDRFETLLTAYLEGPLDPHDANELAGLVRGQLVCRKRFLFQTELNGLIWARLAPEHCGARLAQRTLLCLPGAEQPASTVADVMLLVNSVPAEHKPARWTDLSPERPRFGISPVWLAIAAVVLIFGPAAWLAASIFFGDIGPQNLIAVATLNSSTGRTVLLTPRDESRKAVQAGEPLYPMHGVETEGSATVAFQDQTTFTLSATGGLFARAWLRNTQPYNVMHREHSFGKRVTLELGSAHFDVVPQQADTPMIVITPHAEVQVVGTVFTVNVTPTDTAVKVERGEVRVTRLDDRRVSAVLAQQSINTADATFNTTPRK